MNGITVGAAPAGTNSYDSGETTGASSAAVSESSGLSKTILETIQKQMADWLQNAKQEEPAGTPGVSDANGAPEIEKAFIDFSVGAFGPVLKALAGKMQEGQIQTAKGTIAISQEKLAENHSQNIEKILEYARKFAEASNNKPESICGWISKAFTFLASLIAVAVSAVATVASGGAAGPALVLAVVGLAASAMSMASSISQECGGPPLELSSLMTKAVGAFLVACGVPSEQAESIGKLSSGIVAMAFTAGAVALLDPSIVASTLSGAMELGAVDPAVVATVQMAVTVTTALIVGLATAVVTMGGAATAIVGDVSKLMDSASKIGDGVSKLGTIVQGAASVASGGTAIGAGADKIKTGDARHDAELIAVDQKKIESVTLALTKAMQDATGDLKDVLAEIEKMVLAISKLIAGSAENLSDITSNVGGRSTV